MTQVSRRCESENPKQLKIVSTSVAFLSTRHMFVEESPHGFPGAHRSPRLVVAIVVGRVLATQPEQLLQIVRRGARASASRQFHLPIGNIYRFECFDCIT